MHVQKIVVNLCFQVPHIWDLGVRWYQKRPCGGVRHAQWDEIMPEE